MCLHKTIKSLFYCIQSDEVCEREIEVDGEPATVSLLDTWDVEVRRCVGRLRRHPSGAGST